MSTLRIQHIAGDEPRFNVIRLRDAKQTQPVAVTSPVGFPVADRPDSDLVRELRWYLEKFLDYPFSPETEHAERILKALGDWGTKAFEALLGGGLARDFLNEAKDDKRYDRLTLQIASDDPRILAWPWEALEDPLVGRLAQTCQIERRVDEVADPAKLDPRLPRDRVNILLVTCRPYESDVRFRSIARPLVELVDKLQLPATVTVLRPPTFDQLRRHLAENPHTYHVLHFDGHGGYGVKQPAEVAPGGGGGAAAVNRHMFDAEGVLVFENAAGGPDEISAEKLTELLREHAVPAVVLNACQSAMLDERANDPFASVAAALLKSGMRSVVAMAYSLYVSAARQFVPAFYEGLFRSGDVARAVRAGRQQMLLRAGRICARGEFPLQDWLVPVVYQQDPLDFSFAAQAAREVTARRESRLPAEARDSENPYGFSAATGRCWRSSGPCCGRRRRS